MEDLEITRQDLYAKLKDVGNAYRENKKTYNALEKETDKQKAEIKEILSQLEVDNFKDDDIKITITTIDKSYLDNELTLKYLKEHGLEKYIRTKEYFEPDDLIIASNNGELDLTEISQFKVEKTETRLTVR